MNLSRLFHCSVINVLLLKALMLCICFYLIALHQQLLHYIICFSSCQETFLTFFILFLSYILASSFSFFVAFPRQPDYNSILSFVCQ